MPPPGLLAFPDQSGLAGLGGKRGTSWPTSCPSLAVLKNLVIASSPDIETTTHPPRQISPTDRGKAAFAPCSSCSHCPPKPNYPSFYSHLRRLSRNLLTKSVRPKLSPTGPIERAESRGCGTQTLLPSTVCSRPVSCQTPSSQPSFSIASVCSATIQLVACPTHPRPFARTAPAHSTRATHCALAHSTSQLRTVPLPPSRTKTTCYGVRAALSCATRVPAAVSTMRLLFEL